MIYELFENMIEIITNISNFIDNAFGVDNLYFIILGLLVIIPIFIHVIKFIMYDYPIKEIKSSKYRFYFDSNYQRPGYYKLIDDLNDKIQLELLCLTEQEYKDYLNIYNNDLGFEKSK